METQPHIVETADGSLTMTHPVHGECYHSRAGALSEAMELYGQASGFAETVARTEQLLDLTVLDVGLGLGYNAMVTIELWRQALRPGSLRLVSLEIDAFLVESLATAKAPWQALWPDPWKEAVRGLKCLDRTLWRASLHHPSGSVLEWDVTVRDMRREPLPPRARDLDFIWQDPFSPKKNPAMWSSSWFERLRARASGDCRLVTYSVARPVRDALEDAGWLPRRIPAAGTSKRHWLLASPDH